MAVDAMQFDRFAIDQELATLHFQFTETDFSDCTMQQLVAIHQFGLQGIQVRIFRGPLLWLIDRYSKFETFAFFDRQWIDLLDFTSDRNHLGIFIPKRKFYAKVLLFLIRLIGDFEFCMQCCMTKGFIKIS
ncbi:hypothetical protein D3C71_1216050 [compost metagenome]